MRRLFASKFLVRDIALINPYLHTDAAESRTSFVEPVVDIRAQSVQGYATLAVELAAAHFGTAKTARALHSDALGTGAASSLDRFTHGAAECHPGCELFSYALGNELSIGLGVTHLEDVQLYLLTGELFELTANAVRFGTMTADNNSGASSVNIYRQTVDRKSVV